MHLTLFIFKALEMFTFAYTLFSMDGKKSHSSNFSFVWPKTRIAFDAVDTGHIHFRNCVQRITERWNIVETFKHNIYFGLPDLCCYAACRQGSSTYKYDKINGKTIMQQRFIHFYSM